MNSNSSSSSSSVSRAIYEIVIAVFALGFFFTGIGWLFGHPYKSDPEVIGLGILIFSALLIGLGNGFKSSLFPRVVKWIALAFYSFGGLQAIILVAGSAWNATVSVPSYRAWTILVAAVFLLTHKVRGSALKEIVEAERADIALKDSSAVSTAPE